MLPLLIGGAIAQLGSAAIGASASSAARAQAAEIAQQAYDELLKSGMPPDQSKEIVLDKFRQVGTLTPEMEQNINMGISQVSGIKEDPSLRKAQLDSLEQLVQRGKVGLTPEEKAQFNQLRAQNQRDVEAKQQQIAMSAQQRGETGAGSTTAAQLLAAQEGANRASEGGDQLAGEASRNALQAITQSGALSGQVRSQDFSTAATKAQAADELARFNVENARGVQARNIATANQAKAANLAQEQAIANANTQAANLEKQRQDQAKRQYYVDMANRAQALSNAKLGQATQQRADAAATGQSWQNIGAGLAGAAGTVGQYSRDQDWLDAYKKKNAVASSDLSNSNMGTYDPNVGLGYKIG